MSIIDKLTAIIDSDEKKFGGAQDDDFTTNTGFKCFDFLNGQIVKGDNGVERLFTGVSNGRVVQVIGRSGSGKSAFAMQAAGKIISRYENGLMYLFDFEQSNTIDRFRMLTGLPEAYCKSHVKIMRRDISTETVLATLSQIKEWKVANEKELLVDNENGIKDENGKIKKILPPTVVIVDSLAMMLPAERFDAEEIEGPMSQTAVARVNAQFFRKCVQICERGNIILIFVNHITQQVGIGIQPPSSLINYLKQDEALPGGKAPLYITDTLIKFTPSTKLEEDKTYGIKGFEVKVELCKSRHSAAGRSVTMIYDQTNGFREDLSLLEYINANGALIGRGTYYIDGYPDYKFKYSTFAEKYSNEPDFKKIVDDKAYELLHASIKVSNNIICNTEEAVDFDTVEATESVTSEE